MAFHQAANGEKEYHRHLRRKLNRLTIKPEAVKEIGEVLGHGSFAKVMLLEVYGMRYAGKKLRGALFESSNEEQTYLLDKFAEECIRMGQLRHQNIVQLIGVTFSGDSTTLVVELLPTSLTEFVEDYEDVPAFTKGSILLDIANGLNYLHQQDPPIIHGDLSTNNVLLTESLRAKISDFGVAKTLPPSATDGTALLMSLCPHAFTNGSSKAEYNTQVDCFSFGNILVQVVVQSWSDYPSLDSLMEHVSLQEMVDHPLYPLAVQCLQNDPAHRPTSVEIVRKVKVFAENNPPSFVYPIDLWSAYLEANEKVKHLGMELAEMKRSTAGPQSAGQGASCSFEKLKVHVRALEEELVTKKKEIQNRDKEIAAHKSTILSLKKLVTSMKGQDQPDGATEVVKDGQAFTKDPRPVPPAREKEVSPPSPPKPTLAPTPVPRPRAGTYDASLTPPRPTQPTIDLPQPRPRNVSDPSKLNDYPEKSVPPPKPPHSKPALSPPKPVVPPHKPRAGRSPSSPQHGKMPAPHTSPQHDKIPTPSTSPYHDKAPVPPPHSDKAPSSRLSPYHKISIPPTSPQHDKVPVPDTTSASRTSPYHDKAPVPPPHSDKAPVSHPPPDRTPVPRPPPDRTPVPRPSQDRTPVPRPSPDRTPVPHPSPDRTPVPRLSPDRTPAHRPSPDKTPASRPSPDRTPVPRPSPDKMPAHRPSPDKMQVHRPLPHHDKTPKPSTFPYYDTILVPDDTSPFYDKLESFAPSLEIDDLVDPNCYEVPIQNLLEKEDLSVQYEVPLLPSNSKPTTSISKPKDQGAALPKNIMTEEHNKPTKPVQKQNASPRSQKPLPPLPMHAKPQPPIPPPRPKKGGGDPNDPELQMLLARRQQMISEDPQGKKFPQFEKQRRQPTTNVKDEELVGDPQLRERLARQQKKIHAAQRM